MKEERVTVLKMVEAGKISAEEAVKLLDAMHAGKCQNGGSEEFSEKVKEFSKNAEIFAKDVGGKLEAKYKDMEPKMKEAAINALEKTAGVIDGLARSLNESVRNYKENSAAAPVSNGEPPAKSDWIDEVKED
jgi:polyhydroxyalkanoate synthesis regulator phasin